MTSNPPPQKKKKKKKTTYSYDELLFLIRTDVEALKYFNIFFHFHKAVASIIIFTLQRSMSKR